MEVNQYYGVHQLSGYQHSSNGNDTCHH